MGGRKMLYVIGMGPGNKDNMTYKAYEALKNADVVVGYKTYIQLVKEILPEVKITEDTGMKKEIERCQKAIDLAMEGKKVALVSSGDAGIYGMAGLVYQLAEGKMDASEIEIIPGVSASSSCASILGAPLMHDFATISLSDLLTEWELIKERLHCAGKGDFVVALYNPKSFGRTTQIEEARDILLQYKPADTVVGIVRDSGRKNESKEITTLKDMCDCEINMTSTVIIGNEMTYAKDNMMITPRGYVV
jgi:precorrin-3B C17-methyltransferase